MLGRYPVVWGLTGALVATNLAGQCLQSTWVLWTTAQFGWGVRENGLSLAAFGVVSLVFQLGLARVLLPRLGDRRTLVIGLAVAAVEYVCYAFATHGWMVYVIMIAGGMGFLAGQATQGLLSQQVGEDQQGTLQGALTSLASLTGIFGPPIATGLFAYYTRPGVLHPFPGAPFILAACLSALALVISLTALMRLRARRAEAPQKEAPPAPTTVDGGEPEKKEPERTVSPVPPIIGD